MLSHPFQEKKFSRARPAIRLLTFDLDGTLIDSKADLVMSVNAALCYLGRESLDETTVSSYVGQGSQVLIQRSLGEGVSPQEVARGLEYFLNYYRAHKLDHTTLYPGVRETLERLANGSHSGERLLAVLTNKPVRISREILGELGLISLFRCVYGGNSFETKKPDPAGLCAILQETGVAASVAMIVGDSDVDIQTGAAAGIWTCGVTYGFGKLEMESNPPDLLVHSLAELADLLEGLAPQ
ncbi:MAG: HAD hydrolase-like protein [Acidobacteria bacterium]|nr:HAD hydrolase-like protein [Acidobacteriota bacterium]